MGKVRLAQRKDGEEVLPVLHSPEGAPVLGSAPAAPTNAFINTFHRKRRRRPYPPSPRGSAHQAQPTRRQRPVHNLREQPTGVIYKSRPPTIFTYNMASSVTKLQAQLEPLLWLSVILRGLVNVSLRLFR